MRKMNQNDMRGAAARTVPARRRFAPALVAASLVVLLAVSMLFAQGLIFNPVYATVSVDVNPSVQFALNRDLEVIKVQAMNQEAVKLMEGYTYKGLNIDEAVNQWMVALKQSTKYQLQYVLISGVMPQEAQELKLKLEQMQKMHGPAEDTEVAVMYTSDVSVAKEAAKNEISVGRQMMYNRARTENKNYDVNSIKDEPVGEMIQNHNRERIADQAEVTMEETQSLADQTTPVASQSSEQNQEQNKEQNKAGTETAEGTQKQSQSQNTSQESATSTSNTYRQTETNRETNGSGPAAGNTDATTAQNRMTVRETTETSAPAQGSTETQEKANG